jgi:hypothetical protein
LSDVLRPVLFACTNSFLAGKKGVGCGASTKRAAELADCHPGSPEEEEFDRLTLAIEVYEVKRWPEGRPRRRRDGFK